MSTDLKKPPTAIDLFCGAGGLSNGLFAAGFNILGALDCWTPAVKTYRLNFDHPVIEANIRDLSGKSFLRQIGYAEEQVDLIAGGPPCQGYSIQRIGSDNDSRNDLLFEFARFIRELRPRMFVMENVPGLLGRRGAPFAAQFELSLKNAGYAVNKIRINTADYGLPQIRKRIFYYGWLTPLIDPFCFPAPMFSRTQHRTVSEAIDDLPTPASSRLAIQGDPLHWQMKVSSLNLERLRLIPAGGGFEDLPVNMRVDCHKQGASKIGHRNVYGRLAPDKPSVTITARFDSFTRGKFAHPREHRNITLREGARLQTFPDSFRFTGTQEEIAALIGNAIPPLMAEIVGTAVAKHLTVARTKGSEPPPLELRA